MIQEISPALEDYLEGILVLEEENGSVRVKDIANLLEVKAPSAIEALATLAKKGLVVHERYGTIELTSRGRRRAEKVFKRHSALKKFFNRFLGVDDAVAEADACKIEHYLSKETVARMIKFMSYIERLPKQQRTWIKDFYQKG